MSKPNNSESWKEALKFINKCPICSNVYAPDQAQLFAKNETATLVHLTCIKCRSNFVAMIFVLGQGMSSVGMVTDLGFEDAKRLYKIPALTVDEMIDGYKILKNNFHSLILTDKK